MYIRMLKGKFRVSFTDPKTHGEAKEPCFSLGLPDIDFFTEDHDVYLFLAA